MPGQSIASSVGKPVASMGPTPGGEPPALEPMLGVPPAASPPPPTPALTCDSALPPQPSASKTKAIRDAVLVVPLVIGVSIAHRYAVGIRQRALPAHLVASIVLIFRTLDAKKCG
jgi:hypothetical protein